MSYFGVLMGLYHYMTFIIRYWVTILLLYNTFHLSF